MSESRTIPINKKAHYRLGGSFACPTKLLMVFHGYAQLTEFFIKKFEHIANTDLLLVAPEGTNYFYYGEQKKVGSCWMTSRYREDDIHDNNAFLTTVFERIKKEFTTIRHINVLGFSQGVAVALRWLDQQRIVLDKLILWAGSVPVDFCSLSHVNTSSCYFVHGDKDELQNEFSMSKKKLQDRYGSRFKNIIFSGGHSINQEVLRALFSKYDLK